MLVQQHYLFDLTQKQFHMINKSGDLIMPKLLGSLERLNELDMKTTFDETDAVHLNIPLFIRLLEFSREEVKEDAQLHELTERLIELCKNNTTVGMDIYEQLVAGIIPAGSQESMAEMNDKKATAEIIISLEDSEESKAFHKGIEKFCSVAKQGGDIELFAKSSDELVDCDFKAHDFRVIDVEYKTIEK